MYILLMIVSCFHLSSFQDQKYYLNYSEKKVDMISKKEYEAITIMDSVKALNDSIGFKKCYEKNEQIKKKRSDIAFRNVKGNSTFQLTTSYKFTDARGVDLRDKLRPLTINRILWTIEGIKY